MNRGHQMSSASYLEHLVTQMGSHLIFSISKCAPSARNNGCIGRGTAAPPMHASKETLAPPNPLSTDDTSHNWIGHKTFPFFRGTVHYGDAANNSTRKPAAVIWCADFDFHVHFHVGMCVDITLLNSSHSPGRHHKSMNVHGVQNVLWRPRQSCGRQPTFITSKLVPTKRRFVYILLFKVINLTPCSKYNLVWRFSEVVER